MLDDGEGDFSGTAAKEVRRLLRFYLLVLKKKWARSGFSINVLRTEGAF